jgi:hypothetical protein
VNAPKKPRVDRGKDKATIKSRTERAALIGTTGPTSPLWQAQPTLQDLGGKLVTIGVKLGADETLVIQADAAASTARSARDVDLIAFDGLYNAFVSGGETYATTPQDLSGLGLLPAVPISYGINMPADVTVKYNPVGKTVDVYVKCAAGMNRCVIEIAGDQAMTVNLKQFPGDGARQSMGGLPAGTYWVRALHVRSAARSGYTGPVAVIVT